MALDFVAGSCGGQYQSFSPILQETFFAGASGIFVGYPFDTVKECL